MIIDVIAKSVDLVNKTYKDEAGLTKPVQPETAYLVPLKDGTTEHERYVTDKDNTISKQSSGGVIPEIKSEIPEDFFISTSVSGNTLTYLTDTFKELNLEELIGIEVTNSNEIIRVGNDFYLTINYATDGTTNQEVVKLADCYIEDNILIVSSFIKNSTPLSSVHALVYNETDEFLYIAERKYSDTQAGKICKVDSKTLNVIKVSNFPNIPLFGQSTTDIKIFNNKLYIFGGYESLARLVEVSTNLVDYEELYVGTTSERRTHMSDQPFVIYNGKAYISCYDGYVAEDRFKHVKIVEVDLLTKEVRVSDKISVNSNANNTVGTHWMTVYGDKLIFTAYSYGATIYHSSLVRVDIKTLTKEDEKPFSFPITDDNSILNGYIYLNGETFGFETWIDQYPNYPIDNAQLVKINPFDFTDFSVEMNPYNSGYGSYGSINHNPNYQQVELKTLRNTLNTKLGKPTANGVWSVSKVDSVISYVPVSTPNLEAIVQAGNGTTKNIVFQPDQGIAGQIGFSKTTYSYYFGNMNPAHTGAYNVAMGYNALTKVTSGEGNTSYGFNTLANLTTGVQNTVLGTTAGLATTTGTYNTFVGSGAARGNTTGFKNTSIGTTAGVANTTGIGNTYIGFSSGPNNVSGNFNTTLGTYAGQGVTGSNNILIGVGSGANGGAMNNKLVIHNNTTLAGLGPTISENGTFGNINQGNLANALITGDFAELWVKLNGTLSVAPSKLVNNDPTYTKNIVAKPDGTFGWEDKVTVPKPPAVGNFILKSLDGVMSWIAE